MFEVSDVQKDQTRAQLETPAESISLSLPHIRFSLSLNADQKEVEVERERRETRVWRERKRNTLSPGPWTKPCAQSEEILQSLFPVWNFLLPRECGRHELSIQFGLYWQQPREIA